MNFTTRLGRVEKFYSRLGGWFEWIGIAGLLLMVVITGIDVAGAKLLPFLGDIVGAELFPWRLLGAIDIVMLSQIVAIAFAAACTLIAGRHVRVEFIVTRLPQRAQAAIESIVSFLGLGLFVLIIWRLIVLGYSFQSSGEATGTIYIPLYFFAYGVAVASIPVCLVFLVNLVKSLTAAVKG